MFSLSWGCSACSLMVWLEGNCKLNEVTWLEHCSLCEDQVLAHCLQWPLLIERTVYSHVRNTQRHIHILEICCYIVFVLEWCEVHKPFFPVNLQFLLAYINILKQTPTAVNTAHANMQKMHVSTLPHPTTASRVLGNLRQIKNFKNCVNSGVLTFTTYRTGFCFPCDLPVCKMQKRAYTASWEH